MQDKKKGIKSIIGIIVFTVLFIYVLANLKAIAHIMGNFFSIISPFLIGCMIAFIVNVPMSSIENAFFKSKDSKLYKFKRPISMLVSYLFIVAIVVLVVFVVFPEVVGTITTIKDKFPTFIEDTRKWIERYADKYPDIVRKIMDLDITWDSVVSIFKSNGSDIASSVFKLFSSVVSIVINIFIAIVFSIYILSQKEKLSKQVKMIIYSVFKENAADEMMVFGKIANNTFSRFLACQFREGLILGTLFVIAMTIFKMPYPLTIGILIAFTALIPIFGAFFGLVIGAFLILVECPSMVIWFVVLFFALQFFENYIIYPRLVGGGIGLSAIWTLLAVIVGGELMGVVGMFLFIPLVSVIYAYVRSIVYRKIKKTGIDIEAKTVPDNAVPLMEDRRVRFRAKNARNRAQKRRSNYKDFDTTDGMVEPKEGSIDKTDGNN